jgi:predicted nuclease of predicted toxin-antitoxin system
LKILLDENFPLPLYYRLQSSGYAVEHIIILGQRGLKDSELRRRIEKEEIIFLTQDTEFEQVATTCRGKVVISRIRQGLPIQRRVDLWFNAISQFMARPRSETLFSLLETGQIVPLHEDA